MVNDRRGAGLGNRHDSGELKLLRYREGMRRSSELDMEGGAQCEVGGQGGGAGGRWRPEL